MSTFSLSHTHSHLSGPSSIWISPSTSNSASVRKLLPEATRGRGVCVCIYISIYMELVSMVSKPNSPNHFPIVHPKLSFQYRKTTQMALQSNTKRRAGLVAAIASCAVLLSRNASLNEAETANAFELRMTVPDQTVEEAESGIRGHVQSLLQVKDLLESELWKEAQKELRKSSSKLKLDIYTLIQAKPPTERPQLRKLYSTLFNSVTRLDYAARDKDATRVRAYYDDILVSLNDIMSRL